MPDRSSTPVREVTHQGNLSWQSPHVPTVPTPAERTGARRDSIQRHLKPSTQPSERPSIPTRRLTDDAFADPFGDRLEASESSSETRRRLEQAFDEPSISLAAFELAAEPAAETEINLIATPRPETRSVEPARHVEPPLRLDIEPRPAPASTLQMRSAVRLSPPTNPQFELQGPQLAQHSRPSDFEMEPVDWVQPPESGSDLSPPEPATLGPSIGEASRVAHPEPMNLSEQGLLSELEEVRREPALPPAAPLTPPTRPYGDEQPRTTSLPPQSEELPPGNPAGQPPLPQGFDPINEPAVQEPAPSGGASDLDFGMQSEPTPSFDSPSAESTEFPSDDLYDTPPQPRDPALGMNSDLEMDSTPDSDGDPEGLIDELDESSLGESLSDPFQDESLDELNRRFKQELFEDADRDGSEPRGSLAGEVYQGEDDNCDRSYNGRNCCRLDNACATAWQNLQDRDVTTLSLDTAPPFLPFEDDLEKAAELEERQLKRAPARAWYNREGEKVASGKLESFHYNRVVVREDDGETVEIPVNELDSDELCFATSWWNLPPSCELPLDSHYKRCWTPITYTWTAAATCHKPLYYEEVGLERYGHSAGPLLQPLVSATRFYAGFLITPYKMGLYPPNECRYPLGYYRPGSCAPWLLPAVPLSKRAALTQLATMLGSWGYYN
ncbi:MAG: hypothetical protein AAGF97_07540 [Planctomycetota bacterium]